MNRPLLTTVRAANDFIKEMSPQPIYNNYVQIVGTLVVYILIFVQCDDTFGDDE